MTGTTYDGDLSLVVEGQRWRRRQRPPMSLTVLDRHDHLLVLPSDQSGGLRGGDRIATEVRVSGAGAVQWRPPSSSLYFPSANRDATCHVSNDLSVDAGSFLAWSPPVSIPCREARVDQSVTIDLVAGSGLFYWDCWADGRTASGERGAFAWLKNSLEVRWEGRTVFRERWVHSGTRPASEDPAGFHGASQWHLGLAAGPQGLALLEERIEAWKAAGELAEWGELDDGLFLGRVLVQVPRALPSKARPDPVRG